MRSIFFIFTLLLFTFTLVGCSESSSIKEIKANDLNADDIDGTILDVRTKPEFDAGHIKGATLLPLQSIQANRDVLDALDKDKKYYIICRSGNRSTQASEILKEEGFKHITNVVDGMNGWSGEVVTK